MIPVVLAAAAIGAALLAVNGGGSSTADATGGMGGAGETPADKKARDKAAHDAADLKAANEATKAFAGIVTLVGTAVSVSFPAAAPFVAGASASVAVAWSALSTQDKARVWKGELK